MLKCGALLAAVAVLPLPGGAAATAPKPPGALPVGTDAAAAPLTVDTLTALGHDDLGALLAQWGLATVFGAPFAETHLRGVDLVHATKADLEEAFPGIAALHWKRLYRMLDPVWGAARVAVGADGAATAAAGGAARGGGASSDRARRLADATGMNMDDYTGVNIKNDNAIVMFSDDNAIFRTDDALVLAADEINVTGSLRVTGSIVNGGIADIIDDVDDLAVASSVLFDAVETATGESALGHSASNPAHSCRHILQMGGTITNGRYWITRVGDEDPFLAYCDMTRGGLEMIAKIVGGAGSTGYAIWTSDGSAYNSTADMHPFKSSNHWVSPRLNTTWDSAGENFNAIYTSAFIGGREEVYMTFKTNGTDSMSWFAQDRLIDSSWTDLMDSDAVNHFSILGEGGTVYRNWYVNSAYGGCSVDNGWFGIAGRTTGCSWEITNDGPMVLFSPYGVKSAADGGIDGWQQADTFAVFADYDKVYDSCEDALEQSNFRASNGQYWVNHAGNTDPQIVQCDMEHGGYEMVFKLVTGGVTSGKVLGSNSGGTGGDEQGCDLWTDTTRDYPLEGSRNVDVHDEEGELGAGEHYLSGWRHMAFTNDAISVDDIEVRIVTDEETKKYFNFAGVNDVDFDEWFALAYLRTSSYSDMFNANNYNYFSTEGHAEASRCWYINSQYGGCSVDGGWMVVAGRDSTGCAWEQKWDYPDVMYATGTTEQVSDQYAQADLMAVYYKWSVVQS